MKSEIGKIIKDNRIKQNLSHEDLGKKLNMTRQAMSNWERGKTQPDIDTIRKLSDIFNISIDNFLNEDKEESYNFTMIWILLVLSIGIGFVSLVLSEYKVIMQVFILPAYIIVVAVFYSSIKTNSYGMIAGYNSKVNYNMKIFKKILYNIILLSVLNLIIYQILNFVFILIEVPKMAYEVLFYGIIISFFVNIFGANFKYRDELIPDKIERERLKKESRPTNVFLIKFLITFLVFMIMFKISSTKNNTIEALKFLGIFGPNMILFLIMVLRREYKKSEYLFKSDKIMLVLSFALDIMTVIYGLRLYK